MDFNSFYKIHTKDGLKLEQFTKEKLIESFREAGLEVEINELTPISYMCVATK